MTLGMEDHMHQKIMDYVNYQFRFDKRENLDSIKQEMMSNLIDRYDDLVKDGMDEKKAYIETVKRIGNIDETSDIKVDQLYLEKPSWAVISMITVSVLAIGGLAISLMSNVIGLIVTLGSIGLFATASYALYADSQHKRALEHDIDSQKVYFQTILKTFNKNYVIWSITIAIVFSSLILNLIFLISAESISQVVLESGIGQIIAVFFIVWFIVFIILFAILKSLQGSLYKKYIYITGDLMTEEDRLVKTYPDFKQGYELILFIYLILTTLAIWASPIAYYEYINGNGMGFETTFIGAVGDLPLFYIPIVFSLGILIFMGINLKSVKAPRWLLFVLTSLSYLGYITILVIYQNVLPGLIEAKITAIAIYFSLSLFGHLIYLISSLNRKK